MKTAIKEFLLASLVTFIGFGFVYGVYLLTN